MCFSRHLWERANMSCTCFTAYVVLEISGMHVVESELKEFEQVLKKCVGVAYQKPCCGRRDVADWKVPARRTEDRLRSEP